MKRGALAEGVAALGGILVAAVVAYGAAIRPWHARWGATDAETQEALPGDELVARPRMTSTHAITIEAPAAAVWPWLVQIGQGRGGFYSYDWLENLFGFAIHSADRIVPELQGLRVGDVVRLAPEPGPSYRVATIEPERALVLHAAPPSGATGGLPNGSWAFVLKPADERTTRLVARSRLDYAPDLVSFLLWRVFTEPASFLMERKMLLGLRGRAEKLI